MAIPPDDTPFAPAEAERLLKEGRLLVQQGQALAALEPLRRAVECCQSRVTATRLLPDCLTELGRALQHAHRPDEALTHLGEALARFENIMGTERERARCLGLTAQALGDLARYQEAMARQDEALALLRPLPGTEQDRGSCHVILGVLLSRLGRHEAAIREHEQALVLYRSVLGTEIDQANCQMNIGGCLMRLQRPRECLIRQESALSLVQGLPHTESLQAHCYDRIGGAQWDLGLYEEAIQSLERSLEFRHKLAGTETAQAYAHASIGGALSCLGRFTEAIHKHREAIALCQGSAGTERRQAWSAAQIGLNLIGLGRHEEAVEHLEAALRLYGPIAGTERERSACIGTIGRALVELGRIDEALLRYGAAMALLDAVDAPSLDRAKVHRLAAEALRRGGDPVKAWDRFGQALALYEPEQDREELWQAYEGLGRVQEALGNWEGALSAHLSATEFIEGLREDLTARANKLAFFEDKAPVYGRLIALLVEGRVTDPIVAEPRMAPWGESVDAITFRFAEAAKARALSDLLRERDVTPARVPEEWAAEERRLGEEIARVYTELRSREGDVEAARGLRERIQALELERDLLEMRMKRAAPRRPLAASPSVAEVQALLESDTALIEYAVLPDGDRLAIWVVTREALRLFQVALPTTDDPGLHSPTTADVSLRPSVSTPTASLGQPPQPPNNGGSDGTKGSGSPHYWGAGGADLNRAAPTLSDMVRRLRMRPGELGLEERVRLFRYPMEQRLQTRGKLSTREHQRVGRLLADLVFPVELREHLAEAGVRQLVIVPDGILHHVPFPALILREDPDTARPPRYDACRYLLHDFAVTCVPSALTLASLRREETGDRPPTNDEPRIPIRARKTTNDDSTLGSSVPAPQASSGAPPQPPNNGGSSGTESPGSPHYWGAGYLREAEVLADLDHRAHGTQHQPEPRRGVLAFADPVFTPADPRWPAAAASETTGASGVSGPGALHASSGPADGVADERLPATAEEARAVAALFPEYAVYDGPSDDRSNEGTRERGNEGTRERSLLHSFTPSLVRSEVYLGLAATREQVRGMRMDAFRYLLFATHAHVDEENPMLSCIRLSATREDAGFLHAHEIFGLKLDADLVTLSACESGLGRLARGEGIVGLSMAFLTAGARSLLTSLWRVLDVPTAALVERLHAHLREGRLSRAEALRQAQLERIAAGPDEAHPFFWAFTLMGDWGTPDPIAES